MATWNVRSLTRERFDYCRSLGYDILAVTELWRTQSKYQTRTKEFIASEPKIVKQGENEGQERYPKDIEAGVDILLSPRMQKKVHSFGSEGNRVCWVIAVYMPHRGRVDPNQQQTLADLQQVLSNVPARDCICLLGDFNEQLKANLEGITGKWTGGPPSKNAERIHDLLRLNNLVAVNTMFHPNKHQSVNTFLQTKRSGATGGDEGLYVGRDVKAKYRGRWIDGKILSMCKVRGYPQWVVRYNDGFTDTYSEKKILKMLVHVTTPKEGKQIDYICVSHRWVSSVRSAKVRWAPSIHRDIHGDKNDHALVSSTWTWRIRSPKKIPDKDFNVLLEGDPRRNKYLQDFNAAVQLKHDELSANGANDAHTLYANMSAAIAHAIDKVLPTVIRTKGVKRKVSVRTRKLYDQRTVELITFNQNG